VSCTSHRARRMAGDMMTRRIRFALATIAAWVARRQSPRANLAHQAVARLHSLRGRQRHRPVCPGRCSSRLPANSASPSSWRTAAARRHDRGNAVVRADPDGHTDACRRHCPHHCALDRAEHAYDTARELAGALMIGQKCRCADRAARAGLEDCAGPCGGRQGEARIDQLFFGRRRHRNAPQCGKFRLSAGFEAVHIPYKGAPRRSPTCSRPRRFLFLPDLDALPFIADGRVVALAVSTATRASDLPNVPTTPRSGLCQFRPCGLVRCPDAAKTPRAIIDKFHAAGTKVLATPEMRQKLKGLAVDPMPLAPAEMDKFVADEIAANGRLIKAAGIQ